MSNSQIVEQAKEFLYGNARLLDRKRYEYHFEGGTKAGVIQALRAYRNTDGGFGNALESDIRCPFSQPVPTEVALLIMEEVDGFDAEIIRGIAEYMRSLTLPGGGVPFVLRSAAEYAHAPWWKTESDDRPSMNPTGRIMGLLYKQQALPEIVHEAWFVRNAAYVWSAMANEAPEGFHDAVQWIAFLENVPDAARREAYLTKLDAYLTRPETIERDPFAGGYVQKVLDWCPDPKSYPRKFVNDDVLARHLDMLAGTQQADGGWPISWEAPSKGAELEWRGWVTVERLRTLRAYGVI
ncbi:hypothetical protein GXP70_16865 [Paenibacillus lycopersici]|uniref:Prenyltransferase n=1 Tax=Paenibacillus lycopersici TaxID=2704462 RepID=A0A6C0G2K9_9BACL|nr:hypothetical protein [Paenibacillus lycopersici]QHT61469.1 hypothetical protein GXP70_16865 [Paenibacillus lycopersici]